MKMFIDTKNKLGQEMVLSHKIGLCCLFQRYPLAVEVLHRIDHDYAQKTAQAGYVRLVFAESMVWLGMVDHSSRRDRARILAKVSANQRKMRKWAQLAPENCQHLWALVEASRHRALGHSPQAIAAYEQAIVLAKEHKFLADEAMAHEHLGEFFLAQNDLKSAKTQLIEARNAYLRWGARAKVEEIDQKHGERLGRQRLSAKVTDTQSTEASFTSSTMTIKSSFDFVSIIKASQSISGEIVLADLLGKLMKIVAENAGAETCFLIMEQSGEL